MRKKIFNINPAEKYRILCSSAGIFSVFLWVKFFKSLSESHFSEATVEMAFAVFFSVAGTLFDNKRIKHIEKEREEKKTKSGI